MRSAAIVGLRRHDPNIVGDVGGDLLEYGNAAGADAVVVGDENAHGCRIPSRTCEPRFRPRDRT